MSQWLIVIGLFLDVIGALILFFFSLPSSIRKSGMQAALWRDVVDSIDELTPDERAEDNKRIREQRRWKRIENLQWFAFILLMLGFSMQIAGVWPLVESAKIVYPDEL